MFFAYACDCCEYYYRAEGEDLPVCHLDYSENCPYDDEIYRDEDDNYYNDCD